MLFRDKDFPQIGERKKSKNLHGIFGRHGHCKDVYAALFAGFFLVRLPALLFFSSGSDCTSCGPFLPSVRARLCFSASIRSTGGASLRGFSTAATCLPSRWAWISFFRFSSKAS